MLKTERMSKLSIIGPKTVMADVIDRLYEMKIYHIVDHKKTGELDIGSPLAKAGELSEVLVRIRSLCSSLKIDPLSEKPARKKNGKDNLVFDARMLKDAMARAGSSSAKLAKYAEELKLAGEKAQKLREKKELFEKLDLLNLDFDTLSDYESLSYRAGLIEDCPPQKLREDLDKKTRRYKLYYASYNGKKLIAVFFERDKDQDIIDVLGKKGFSEIDVSQAKGLKGSIGSQLKSVKEELARLSAKQKELEKGIDSMRREEREFLLVNEGILSAEAEKAEAPLRFASTIETFAIKGWVPTARLERTLKELNHATKEKLYIRSEPAGNAEHGCRNKHTHSEEEEIPIKLKNPSLVKPFEFFMDMYTLPNYKEIDPTFLMFLTFPLFYGFMLGDIGYGLVTLVLFLYLRKKISGDFKRLVDAMIFASISSLIFGALFGEVFGLEKFAGYELMHVINRAEQVNELMIVAVAIGVVHINIGLLVGFYNILVSHGFKAAFLEKISWIILEAGVAVTALTYTNYLPLQKWIGFAVMGAAVVMIYLGEGPKGIVELPSIFSQTISYTRLMAVGLASVILAVVVNDLAGELFHAGIFGIIAGIVLLVVGHAINIALGLISPFLHSLRLHYVEFFTKFYQGGGMRYVPFGTRDEQ